LKQSKLWAVTPLKEVYSFFRIDPAKGLSEAEARQRLKQHGPNSIKEKRQKNILEIFLNQFRDFMVLILLAATLVSGILKEYSDAIIIIIIVFLNAFLGFLQEYRAEKSFLALKKLSPSLGRVYRNGSVKEVAAEEIVSGDLVIIQAGDRVCADLRIIAADSLMIDESPLTGESVAVEKEAGTLKSIPSSLGDAVNMAFSGTLVTGGSGQGIVTATGMVTEMGKIASLIQEVETHSTPLQKRLAKLGKFLVVVCLIPCFFVVLLGLWRGKDLYGMLMSGISLAVAAIPEGLPAIVTVALALGVQRMARHRAIVRRLPAVETLGCATVICSDKTGTITQNKMTVKKVFAGSSMFDVDGEGYDIKGNFFKGGRKIDVKNDPHLVQAMTIAVLCNNASLQRGKGVRDFFDIQGNPTEGALLISAAKAGIWKEELQGRFIRIKEFPFSSGRKSMAVICRRGAELHLFVKGAPEKLLERCTQVFADGGKVKPLNMRQRREILSQVELMAAGAQRTLAVAFKPLGHFSEKFQSGELETDLIFAGFFGMIDPPRPGVFKAIQKCEKAGIKVVMITGDHRNTAVAIARQLGMLRPGDGVVTGAELDMLSEKDFSRRIEGYRVYARVNPEHKLRIVRCLKEKGHIVAMTGDGVNDAPAIKEADIGVAMGCSGTEVTREAASLVLADDNFNTIVAAVEEGRNIYDNIRKFIRFLLGCNLGEILTMFLAMLLGLPLPLRPIQILWVNLITDGLPALALGVDPPEENVMSRPPRAAKENIFGRGLWLKILSRGFIIGVTSLIIFALTYLNSRDLVYAQSMALTTLIMTQLVYAFECRSEYLPIWENNPAGNFFLIAAISTSIALLLLILYNPLLQELFGTTLLSVEDWIVILIAIFLPYFFNFISWSYGKLFYRAIAEPNRK
jgi:Ca2+-transporting ATPase